MYTWAGDERSVNMSKGDFHFAVAAQIPQLLADVMMGQAGYPPLDYSDWDQNKAGYFAAIRQGLEMIYAPMIELVAQAMGNN